MEFLLTRHWETMIMGSVENHNPHGTHPYPGHKNDQIVARRVAEAGKVATLGEFAQSSGTIQSCSPRKQTTGPLSDRLPALQRDLFLNFHTQESPTPSSKGRGTTGICVSSAAPRPLPQSPAQTDVPLPHELPNLSPRAPPPHLLPFFPSFPPPARAVGGRRAGGE